MEWSQNLLAEQTEASACCFGPFKPVERESNLIVTHYCVLAYYSSVRSILEYGSVIWASAADTHTVRVDRVQHKFLKETVHLPNM